jgi:hypothetical protein
MGQPKQNEGDDAIPLRIDQQNAQILFRRADTRAPGFGSDGRGQLRVPTITPVWNSVALYCTVLYPETGGSQKLSLAP